MRRQQTRGFGKGECRHGICIRIAVDAGLYRDPVTAFGAATCQHFAAVGGGHTCTEAVSACAAEVARLESSFHGVDPARETITRELRIAREL